MTQPLSNGATPDGPSQRVDDDDNTSQTATIQRIHDYRDTIADYQLAFAQNELSGDVDAGQQHRAYHQLAKGFLQLLKPYLTDQDVPGTQYYWEGYTADSLEDASSDGILRLGTVTADPPDAIRTPSRDEVADALREGDQQTIQRADPRNAVDGRSYDIVGLLDFASAPAEWTEEWRVMFGPEVTPHDLRQQIRDPDVRVRDRRHRNEPITVVKTMRVPRSVIDNAVTALENFVRDLGMDVDLQPEPYMGEGEPGI